MAKIGRLAGAILIETEGDWYLVGEPKQPCDFGQKGFEKPVFRDSQKIPYQKLIVSGNPKIEGPFLLVELEGEEIANLVFKRFAIERTHSVSERLWRLVTQEQGGPISVRWLNEVPAYIWEIIRDSVLKCS